MCFIVRCLACGTAMKQLLLCICIWLLYSFRIVREYSPWHICLICGLRQMMHISSIFIIERVILHGKPWGLLCGVRSFGFRMDDRVSCHAVWLTSRMAPLWPHSLCSSCNTCRNSNLCVFYLGGDWPVTGRSPYFLFRRLPAVRHAGVYVFLYIFTYRFIVVFIWIC